jgi:hypothetical protein
VGVDDVGSPVVEGDGQTDEVVVGRRRAGDEVGLRNPRQIRRGAEHADGVVRWRLRTQGSDCQHDDVVTGGAEGPAQTVDVGGRAARQWRVLPRQHEDPHRPHLTGGRSDRRHPREGCTRAGEGDPPGAVTSGSAESNSIQWSRTSTTLGMSRTLARCRQLAITPVHLLGSRC